MADYLKIAYYEIKVSHKDNIYYQMNKSTTRKMLIRINMQQNIFNRSFESRFRCNAFTP